MSALTANRDTKASDAYPMTQRRREIASGATLYLGSIMAQNSAGKAVPASDTAGLVVLGRCEKISGDDVYATARSGLYKFANGSSSEALAVTDLNSLVYVVDDQTVGKVGGTNHIKAGVLREIDADGGVWVELGNIRLT